MKLSTLANIYITITILKSKKKCFPVLLISLGVRIFAFHARDRGSSPR